MLELLLRIIIWYCILCVLTVFSIRRQLLKLILVDEPLPEVFLSQLVIGASLRQHTST
jgi:hypothetical protein